MMRAGAPAEARVPNTIDTSCTSGRDVTSCAPRRDRHPHQESRSGPRRAMARYQRVPIRTWGGRERVSALRSSHPTRLNVGTRCSASAGGPRGHEVTRSRGHEVTRSRGHEVTVGGHVTWPSVSKRHASDPFVALHSAARDQRTFERLAVVLGVQNGRPWAVTKDSRGNRPWNRRPPSRRA
eukprot:2013048-Rhodomonas_salina.1